MDPFVGTPRTTRGDDFVPVIFADDVGEARELLTAELKSRGYAHRASDWNLNLLTQLPSEPRCYLL